MIRSTDTPDDEARLLAMRAEADGIARRRSDAILAHPSAQAKLIDCEVCGGSGAMTARRADATDALPTLIPCPACAGRGAVLQRLTPSAPLSLGEQLDQIGRDLDATSAAWKAAGYPSTGPEIEAREAVFTRLRAWNAAAEKSSSSRGQTPHSDPSGCPNWHGCGANHLTWQDCP